jgi:hypothetical protein
MATADEEARMLDQVNARLRSRFPDAAPDLLRHSVEAAYHELDGAPIRDFVEILVERQVADRLAHSNP